MRDLAALDHALDKKTAACRAIIETPRGERDKFDYDRETGLFKLKRILPEGMSFPTDFGFIPSTLAEDGDPLDVMVFTEAKTFPGALVEVRLIGVIEARQTEGGKTLRNDRLLAVARIGGRYAKVNSPADLPKAVMDQLTAFWINKDALEGRLFEPLGLGDAGAAAALVRKTAKAFGKKG